MPPGPGGDLGGGLRPEVPSSSFSTRTSEYNHDKEEVPTWDGSPSTWRTFLRRVELWQESTQTPVAKQGPKLASKLRGVAFDATEGVELAELRKDVGVTYLIDLLRTRLQVSELHLQGAILEEFFVTLP